MVTYMNLVKSATEQQAKNDNKKSATERQIGLVCVKLRQLGEVNIDEDKIRSMSWEQRSKLIDQLEDALTGKKAETTTASTATEAIEFDGYSFGMAYKEVMSAGLIAYWFQHEAEFYHDLRKAYKLAVKGKTLCAQIVSLDLGDNRLVIKEKEGSAKADPPKGYEDALTEALRDQQRGYK